MRNKRNKRIVLVVSTVISLSSLIGCAALNDWIATTKGDLIGQNFTITTYDDFANKTLTIQGSSVNVGLLTNSANFNSESSGFKSEVIEITIKGRQAFQVGNTVIFAEKGLDIITDFEVPEEILAESVGTRFIPYDRFINDWKNVIGDKKTVIISSQMGIPIGVFQGNEVFVTIPSDLPKMTRLNIDGKSLYIHRANYIILDSDLIE